MWGIALTTSDTILAALFESVIALDHLGRVLFINPAAGKLFEMDPSRVKGRPFLEVLRLSALNAILSQVLEGADRVTQEITIHSPSERILTVQACALDHEGRRGVLAALHDIT